ncbi:hypothetical protein IMX26_11050 [Clostridium sp. 'deep sea']|nr:CD1871A family CXXC motif-containing protein [Clostridium sp. 'deep sea']QOR34027.1 hypothetical protein IMX26_11050 [Clostridium sp. 'deep sea']
MNKRRIAKITIVVSLVFIAVGITRGEVQEVFTKAINICLECIGIG